ncbi:MAG: polysaccharide deacetylase family protein [Intrasporangium sp.]|uniref:polysaccharide deacetylase family protein n=1 Tax=Intrasporangium sp. TaxID=1925024 RepID=UPI003F7F407A
MIAVPVPVLLYHCVSPDPSSWIAPFTVTAHCLDRHLALIGTAGRTPVTVSQLRDGLSGAGPLPTRPVVVTFDDGFADTLTAAAPVLHRHHVRSTIYLTTGFIDGVSPGGDRMLDWAQARELADRGHEIGAHSVTHPQLDQLSRARARHEIQSSREMLQERLDVLVRSFAYPHGYSSPAVRRQVMEAGYDSACSVKNVVSGASDTPFSISRLTVTADLSDDTVRRWLDGSAPTRRRDERLLTKGWRSYRRLRHIATLSGGRS